MTENLTKICFKHGELQPHEILSRKRKTVSGFSIKPQCQKCDSLYKKKWRETHPDRVKALQKIHRKTPQFRKKRQEDRMLKEFKMSRNEYNILLENQNNVCAICFKKEKATSRKKKLSIDHCHATGKIRGLLCNQCNLGLGAFNDSIEILNSAIKYLIIS